MASHVVNEFECVLSPGRPVTEHRHDAAPSREADAARAVDDAADG
jgi:hypothetical protein